MCLGVPGQVTSIVRNELGVPTGTVSFAGIEREVCFAYTPEVGVGDWVIVHVGFAISTIDEAEAREVFSYLEQIGDLEGLEVATPASDEERRS